MLRFLPVSLLHELILLSLTHVTHQSNNSCPDCFNASRFAMTAATIRIASGFAKCCRELQARINNGNRLMPAVVSQFSLH